MTDTHAPGPDNIAPESNPPGWNRRNWVIRELRSPRQHTPDTDGITELLFVSAD